MWQVDIEHGDAAAAVELRTNLLDRTRFLLRRPQGADGTPQLHFIVNSSSTIKPQ